MNVEDIQDCCKIGVQVCVFLTTGQQFAGVLSEIRESSIVLRLPSGGKIPIALSAIAAAFHTDESALTEIQELSLPSQTRLSEDESLKPISAPVIEDVLRSPEPVLESKIIYSSEVIAKVAHITARFETGIQQVNLETKPIDLNSPGEITSLSFSVRKNKMQGEWDRLRNIYNNAVKNDPTRIKQVAYDFEQLSETFPELSAAANFNLGCLQLFLGDTSKALKTFEVVAVNFRESRSFYNSAVISLRKSDSARACFALNMFFLQESPADHLTAWYKFIDLALTSGAVMSLSELLRQRAQDYLAEDKRLILDSTVYILERHKRIDDAHQLAEFILKVDIESEEMATTLYSFLSRVEVYPNEAYRQQGDLLLKSANQAQEIRDQSKRNREVKPIIERAKRFASQSMYSQALSEVHKGLKLSPSNTDLKQLEKDYRVEYQSHSITKGNGPYAQAQYAKLQDKDFAKAEKLYRDAIKQGDRLDSAVNDLGSLLIQLNRDEEAIELLRKFRHAVSNKLTTNNVLTGAYIRLGRFQEAIVCLEEIFKQSPKDKHITILNRIASVQYQMRDYQSFRKTTERVLRLNPNDEIAQTRLDSFKKAVDTGIYTDLDALLKAQEGAPDARTNVLSSLILYHLEQCDFTGVEAAKVAAKQFTEQDVERLQDSAEKKLGTARPRERANYYLSAAKILLNFLGSTTEEKKPRAFLRNFCAAMGDACVAEGKPKDVSRSYYAEAFLVTQTWVAQLQVKLVQYIMLYYAKPEAILQADHVEIESCLEKALDNPHNRVTVVEGMLYLSWLNREAGQELISRIHPRKLLREAVQNTCYQFLEEQGEISNDKSAFLALWERGRDHVRRRNQEFEEEFAFLISAASGLDSVQDQIDRIEKLRQKMKGLDQQRLSKLKEILDSIHSYGQQQSYIGREFPKEVALSRITKFIEEVESEPTKFSLSLFRDYVLRLEQTIKKHFDRLQQLAEPEQIQTQLAIEFYTPDDESKIECQLTLTNEQNKSPVSNISIRVKESLTDSYVSLNTDISARDLPGGESITLKIPIRVSEAAKKASVFTLDYTISFSTRKEKIIVADEARSIRLHTADDFKEVFNPYAEYARGGIVENKEIFIGRDNFIDKLIADIQSSSMKNLVIYGQKRAGKSSILYHLETRLELPIIPVRFSIGDLDLGSDYVEADFFYLIIQAIKDALQTLMDDGHPSIDMEQIEQEELRRNPLTIFREYMTRFQRMFKRTNAYKDARIVLLIDEFTYIHTGICQGSIGKTFMKSWKALLERRFFGTVLVGQDTMPRFIEQFPNEFQISEPQRVSYLLEEDALRLIVDPIRIPDNNESRYRGEAVKRLFEVTAGSPFYIQIFCNQLVSFMNSKKAIYVSDADIQEVEKELILGSDLTGANSLEKDVFDNLISAGESGADNITKEETLVILEQIAKGAGLHDYCDRSLITAVTNTPIDIILEDLVRREVIAKRKNAFRIRVRLFKEWLRARH